ncbi:WD repeat-containing protein 27-like [Plakobranchus ocellatus]|uniref:WD repeat-containing protein 27-like n=1 Tax=Plakobranchus ocellatus TaxID=259542 RepID=A0AAV4BZK9_9GAST|nr:WD repeat-containing protein 27-like [Plakobranchus ocellatus]
MEPIHLLSLPLHANPQRLDPCVCREYVALPLNKTIIGLWKVAEAISYESNTKLHPYELIGHDKEINALAFNSSKSTYLASSSRDKVLLWNLMEDCQSEIKSELFFSNPGDATCICFNNTDDVIAIAVDCQILLLKSKLGKPFAVLEAHRSMITGVKFCPHYSSTLVSISDDRTFCVWDVVNMSLLYQSTIIAPAPLISLSMNLIKPHVAIGSADGNVKIFDLTDGHDFRALANIDVVLLLKKERNNKQKTQNNTTSETTVINRLKTQNLQELGSEDILTSAESSESILSIQYAYFMQDRDNAPQCLPSLIQTSGAGDIIGDKSPSLCIITSNSCIQLDVRSLEILQIIDTHNTIQSRSFNGSKIIGSIAFAGLDQCAPLQMIAIMGAMFDKTIDLITWTLMETKVAEDTEKLDFLDETIISVIPVSPISDYSPLKSDMQPFVCTDTVTKGDVATGKKKLTTMNQPLTFKSKIKSSGYTQAPRTTMFKPETSKAKLLGIGNASTNKSTKQKVSLNKILKTNYDTERGPPIEHCDTFVTDSQTAAILNLNFAGDGNGLACAMSNKTGLLLKVPFSKQTYCSFTGHDGAVNAMHWSSDNSLLLSASSDKRACLWSKTGGDPLMVLSHTNGNHNQNDTSQLSSQSRGDSSRFNKEIRNAQFYFMGKFLLLTYGSVLSLYKYYVTPVKDEIKRYNSQNRYKLVSSWETPSSSFTASTAVNSFLSYIVVCATSGRNLEIYDLNRSILALSFTDCHSRPVHCIAINEGSCYAPQPSEAYNVIATSAHTDPIKLWDLRTKTSIQALQGHLNNAHACQIAFSPCGNYLATGSENKTTYIYDLRKGTYINRLRGHSEVVTSVAFHPAYPLLATGSLDSKILFYKAK